MTYPPTEPSPPVTGPIRWVGSMPPMGEAEIGDLWADWFWVQDESIVYQYTEQGTWREVGRTVDGMEVVG